MKKVQKLAVALKYTENDSAPTVVASGKGAIAETILKRAQEENIPAYEDENLAKVLTSVEIGTEIPPELYQAVAGVIAFVWGLDKKYGKEKK
ncbi:flagellar biosynthesis protein [Desulfonispora thiosulfatigenes DSM 11270]|uniref:Flagellar biosynthesis protein n=1 Tax=Desulfonispora thiosulfatigenes DSM 11270 TaxID=656914 RepID=A0A1W1UP97_DESTI|nr:EscU/YscU/HrcU family type III secretion system export apparatus switch protein [Desulfonispora thiosulfatigenes]SMB82534.1 flagellar biosynthesis protein [Desulfonispora thiosulfatigenes DSM 11270]